MSVQRGGGPSVQQVSALVFPPQEREAAIYYLR